MTETQKLDASSPDSPQPSGQPPLTGEALDKAVFGAVCAFLRNNEVRKALHLATQGAGDAAIDEALARLNASGAFHPVVLGFLIEQSLLALRRMFEQATGAEVNATLARHVADDLAFGNGLRAALAAGEQSSRVLSPLEESLVAGALELARRRGTPPASGE